MAILSSHYTVLFLFIALHTLTSVSGHGYLACPTGRSYLSKSAMLAELIPADKPDLADGQNAINCGIDPRTLIGIFQYDFPATNFCGPCGDQIPLATGPVHEYKGIYDRGIIAGRFLEGDIATFTVTLDNPHWGYMEFRLCPYVTQESQECLNKYPLEIMNPPPGSNGSYQYYVAIGERPTCSWDPTNKDCSISQTYKIQVKLPDGVSTKRGVIQWNYVTGKSTNGGKDFECKYPNCTTWEVFRGCADIRIDPYATLLKSSYLKDGNNVCITTTGFASVLGAELCNPNDTKQIVVPRQPWEHYDTNPFYIGFYDSGCATTCIDVFTQPIGDNIVIGAYQCKYGYLNSITTKENQIWKIIPITESCRRHKKWENTDRSFAEDETFLLQQGSKTVDNLCATVYEVAGLLRVRLNTCNPNDSNQRWELAKYALGSAPSAGK